MAAPTSEQLEQQAVDLVKQYRIILPASVKGFLRALADHLNWTRLKGVL
jgi:hypothetical protein